MATKPKPKATKPVGRPSRASAAFKATVDMVATKPTVVAPAQKKPAPAKPKATTPVNKVGAPRKYDRDMVVARLCEILVTSERGTARILKEEPGMPPVQKLWGWMDEKTPDGALTEEAQRFRTLYARAKRLQAEHMEGLLLEIADDSRNDYMDKVNSDGSVSRVPDHENIQRSRIRLDTRKWLMAKLYPKKYADSLKLGGDDALPAVKTEGKVDVIHSFDDLRAALTKKLGK